LLAMASVPSRTHCLIHRYRQQAGSYGGAYLSKHICIPLVGASLLAMDVNDNAGCLNERVVRTLFASKPAPTGHRVRFCFSPRLALLQGAQ